ncbi:MAG: hypothetical protein IPI79_10245 [Moraxellaceae bacterium]|nr:hypothetical protein [Moraxellaceae bacterium]
MLQLARTPPKGRADQLSHSPAGKASAYFVFERRLSIDFAWLSFALTSIVKLHDETNQRVKTLAQVTAFNSQARADV